MSDQRSHWGSRLGFVLAAAGSAIGLGNIWKFPYITGANGGGWFVLIYLVCIATVGLPIMMAEIFIGRTAQKSPVGAFRALSRRGSPWVGVGWLGVVAGFVILSYYSVVAGWAMHYVWLSITGSLTGETPQEIEATFGGLYASPGLNLFWHTLFMALTVSIVLGGIRGGLERASKILMPLLFLMMVVLLVRSTSMEGFGRAVEFVFKPNADSITPAGVLEALGHSFFTLSLGMGAMITYGSYLRPDDDLVSTSITVGVLDTVIALMACLVLFPITFSYGMEPSKTVGLVFMNMPMAFAQMPGGALWGAVFFILLTFAALTSGISLLEVTASYFMDERGWSRTLATSVCGGVILLLGIPSALSGATGLFGGDFQKLTAPLGLAEGKGMNWFDFLDYLASNWMLPLGGLGIAMFVAWRVGGQAREQGFKAGSRFGRLYWGWVFLLRYVVPIGVGAVFLHAIGVI
jgi:NSS family neurotransmitter:Na+ symporter